MNISQLVLISELVMVDHGKYIVKVTAQINQVILGTALAAESTVEKAEDNARIRVKELIQSTPNLLNSTTSTPQTLTPPTAVTTTSQANNLPANKTTNLVRENKSSSVESPTTSLRQVTPSTINQVSDISVKQANKTVSQPDNPPVINQADDRPSQAQIEVDTATNKEETESLADSITTPLPKPTAIDNSKVTPINRAKTNSVSNTNTNQEENNTKNDQQPELDFSAYSDPVTTNDNNNDNSTIELDANSNGLDNIKTEPTQPIVEENQTSTQPVEASETLDFKQIMAQTMLEMKRLGWTVEDGKKHLLEHYGKKSRNLLSDPQLLEFLQYLQQQPTPEE